MARKSTALADLDIEGEALSQQDGLAERIARKRNLAVGSDVPRPTDSGKHKPADLGPGSATNVAKSVPPRDPNAWRKNKSLIQVAIDEESHVELSILAKRRRITLSQLVKSALNDWLNAHGHTLKIPD